MLKRTIIFWFVVVAVSAVVATSTGCRNGDTREGSCTLRTEAEQGDASAQFMLGVCYHDGTGVRADRTEAIKWLRMSAAQKNEEAIDMLRTIEKSSPLPEAVQNNAQEEISTLRTRAEQGDAVAQNQLGLRYYEGNGVPENKEEAVTWLRKAADRGLPSAQGRLGLCYYYGDGIGKVVDFEYLSGATKGRMGRIFRLREDIVPGTSLGL